MTYFRAIKIANLRRRMDNLRRAHARGKIHGDVAGQRFDAIAVKLARADTELFQCSMGCPEGFKTAMIMQIAGPSLYRLVYPDGVIGTWSYTKLGDARDAARDMSNVMTDWTRG